MDNLQFQKIKDKLNQSDNVGVAVGKNPTLDELAGALGLYLSLRAANKSVSIACPTEPAYEFSTLAGIDRVRSAFEGNGGDLVVSFPYREGEIEKVSYTIEDNYLNIVVKAGEQGLNFDEKDVRYTRGGGTPNLLFIVGTPRLSNLGNLFNPEALKETMVVNVDNKEDNQGYGDVVLVSPKFSSLSEQIADLIMALGFDFDLDAAQNLLTGISDATGNFQDPRTSYLAFEVAAILMKKGATRQPLRSSAPAGLSDWRTPRPAVSGPQSTMPRQQQPRFQDQLPERPAQRFPEEPEVRAEERGRPDFASFMRDATAQDMNSTTNTLRQPEEKPQKAPADWLTPKVYKGSTSLE